MGTIERRVELYAFTGVDAFDRLDSHWREVVGIVTAFWRRGGLAAWRLRDHQHDT